MAAPRVIVVGAGPAGVRAAETLVNAGLRPIVIDEGRADGGRIYQRQPDHFTRSYETLYGSEARAARAVHQTFESLREHIDYRPETLVWNIRDRNLYCARDARNETLPWDALIVCSGATDRLLPVPGWQFAGTYSLGGSQLVLKSQGCAIGRRVAFVGSGPLLYLVAAQYAAAGANVAGVFDTSPWRARLRALPALLAGARNLRKGIGLELSLRRAGVRVHRGITPLQIEGAADPGVSGLTFRDAAGRTQRVDCDAVALGWHLRPETQLADLARCEFAQDARNGLWLPRIDVDGRSSVPGIYLAGDGARIRGAQAAECSGALAALAALADLGADRGTASAADPGRISALRAQLQRHERFAAGLMAAFPWPAQLAATLADDTIVCRCEGITAGELRRGCTELGAREANRAKSFTRVGMGRCQGRYCGDAATLIVAATSSLPLADVGRLRAQAPVKPLPLALEQQP